MERKKGEPELKLNDFSSATLLRSQNPGIIHNHKFFGDVPCIVDLKTGVATTPK